MRRPVGLGASPILVLHTTLPTPTKRASASASATQARATAVASTSCHALSQRVAQHNRSREACEQRTQPTAAKKKLKPKQEAARTTHNVANTRRTKRYQQQAFGKRHGHDLAICQADQFLEAAAAAALHSLVFLLQRCKTENGADALLVCCMFASPASCVFLLAVWQYGAASATSCILCGSGHQQLSALDSLKKMLALTFAGRFE